MTSNTSDEFRGDITKNEVEMNLEKFVKVMNENIELKGQLLNIEKNLELNPWQKWIHFARMVDSWRLWSRAFITVYMVLLYYTTIWFMSLEAPTMEQSGLISVIVGAGAAWFGLYVKSGPDNSD